MQNKIVNNAQSNKTRNKCWAKIGFSILCSDGTGSRGRAATMRIYSRMQMEFAALHFDKNDKMVHSAHQMQRRNITIAKPNAFCRFRSGADFALERTSLSKSFRKEFIHILSSQLSLSPCTGTTSSCSSPRQQNSIRSFLSVTVFLLCRCRRIEIVFIRWFWKRFKLTACGIMTPPSNDCLHPWLKRLFFVHVEVDGGAFYRSCVRSAHQWMSFANLNWILALSLLFRHSVCVWCAVAVHCHQSGTDFIFSHGFRHT